MEYKQKPFVELLVYFLMISYTSAEEYEQKSSVELLVYFLADFIHF
jgi:hypothetical protein